MRVAVISDIHANEQALDAVLGAIDAAVPDAIWCLGDVVGYGPAPNQCCAVVAERADVCLVGNHDLVVLGRLDAADFNEDAAAAALWTRHELDDESRAFLDRLEPSAVVPGAELFHASARDPIWEYVLSAEAAYGSLIATTAPLVLVGHSHVPLAIGLDDASNLHGGLAEGGSEIELAGRWLLNPGSVGQPRDGDARAAWLELDTDAGRARFHRVEYAIEETQAAMRARGLPEALAERLAHGS
jgi:diadenosine tetraphosphatase ApaH/serine/threonine PP2A family protein phosphatase